MGTHDLQPLDPERAAVLEQAAQQGFPRVPLRPAVYVIGGERAWNAFVRTATDEELRAAVVGLQSQAQKTRETAESLP